MSDRNKQSSRLTLFYCIPNSFAAHSTNDLFFHLKANVVRQKQYCNPEARHFSMTPFQVVTSPPTELLAMTGEEDASLVVRDLIAFPNSILGS
jgi:hypothetical protein